MTNTGTRKQTADFKPTLLASALFPLMFTPGVQGAAGGYGYLGRSGRRTMDVIGQEIYPSHLGFRFSECVNRAPGQGSATSHSKTMARSGNAAMGCEGRAPEAENPGVTGITPTARGSRPPAAAVPSPTRELVFVAPDVADARILLRGLSPDTGIVYLSADSDGLAQMAAALRGRTGIRAIHILAHGHPGGIRLGATDLTRAELNIHVRSLAQIGAALAPGADILVYACNTARGAEGAAFVSRLARLTGADVAASDDPTGARTLGGDWNLEVHSGDIQTAALHTGRDPEDYGHLLYTASVGTLADLKNALASAAADGADDTITLTANIAATASGDFSAASDGHPTLLVIAQAGHGNLNIDGGGFTIDADYFGRVFEIQSGTVNIDDVTIQNGLAFGNGGDFAATTQGGNALGGLIRNAGTLTISYATLSGGRSAGGGGAGGGTSTAYSFGSYGGGGGGGYGGRGGGDGGTSKNTTNPAQPGGSGIGGDAASGTGGDAYAGQGGSTTGGTASAVGLSGGRGGAGGTAGNIGGGGGGYSYTSETPGGHGGTAVGGIYNAGTLNISSTTLSDNAGAGGGGGGSYKSTAGDGGFGVGAIYNANGSALNYQSSTVTFTGNAGGGGAKGLHGTSGSDGVDGVSTADISSNAGATVDPNYVPANKAPTISNLAGDSLSYDEDSGPLVIDQGTPATVTDADSADFDGGSLTVSIASGGDSAEDVLAIRNEGTGAGQIGVSGSNVTYGGTTIGSFTGGTGTSDLVVSFNASSTPAAAQALVRNVTYEDTDTAKPTTGARTVRFVLSDGDGGTSGDYDTTVTVTTVNDPPVVTAGGTLNYTENQGLAYVDGGITISDADDTQLSGATVQISAGYSSGDLLQGTQPGVTYSWNATTGTLTLTGTNTLTVYQTALRGVQFRNNTDNPTATSASRTITWQVTDADSDGVGAATSSPVTSTIDITAVNDAPVLDNTQSPVLTDILEDDTNSAGDTVADIVVNGSITDPDGTAVEAIAVTEVDNTHGTWQYNIGSGWTGFSATTGSPVDLSSNARLLDGTALVRFVPDADYNGSSSFGFRAWDQSSGSIGGTADTTTNGGTSAFSSASDSAIISIIAVNDPPDFTASNPPAVLEDSGAHTVTGWVSAIDPGAADESGQTVSFTVSNLSDASFFTANPAVDTSGNLTYTLAAGKSGTVDFDVTAQDDGGGANGGSDTSATKGFTLTVGENDITHDVTAGTASLAEGDSSTQQLTFTVSRSGATGQASSVDFSIGGSATSGSDYDNIGGTSGATTTSGTIAFGAGETSKTITLDLLGDTLVEPDETIQVTLTSPTTAAAGYSAQLSTATATTTVQNDDTNLVITPDSADKNEGNSGTTAFTFTVTRSGLTGGASSADWAVSGSGANSASADDFDGGSLPSGSVSFSAGETSQTITVYVAGDPTNEADEGFTVTLANPVGATLVTATASASGTIRNDDAVPGLGIDDVNVGAEGDVAQFTVTLNPASGQQVTVDVNTQNGTAVAGEDFDADSQTLTFTAGETTKTVQIQTINDSLEEDAETFTVELSNAVNATITDASGSATIPANDDDGISSSTEDGVPDADGSGTGDGNGDGLPDSEQGNVTSLQTSEGDYVTLANGGPEDGLLLTEVSTAPAPLDAPAGVAFPYGTLSFVVNDVGNGGSVEMEIYVPYNPRITDYYKWDRVAGAWDSVGATVSHEPPGDPVKTRISFTLVDGDRFDMDELADGKIHDPGGPVIANQTTNGTGARPEIDVTGVTIDTTAADFFNLLCDEFRLGGYTFLYGRFECEDR